MPTIKLLKLYPAQQEIKDKYKKCRFITVASARRWGKSILGLDLCITKALDTGNNTAFISISYKQLLGMFDIACEVLAPIAKFDRQNKRIILPAGNSITFWSSDNHIADKIRGAKYQHITIDEASFMRGLKDTWNMVLRPTLIDYKGSALFIGTPNGFNEFYSLYKEADRNPYLWYSYRASSYDNPYLDKDELDSLKEALPERVYRQEILANFLESDQGVFTNISSLFQEVDYIPNGLTAIGIDFARSGDNTAMTVMRGDTVIDLLVYTDMSFSQQIETVKELYRKYKPEIIIIESNGVSMPLVEELTNSGLPISPFVTTNDSKKIIIENLAIGIEQRLITVKKDLPYANQLADELAAYESKKSSTGKVIYNAPSGYHDDTVISLALAYSVIREDQSSLVIWG